MWTFTRPTRTRRISPIRSGGSVQPEISQDEQWVEKLAFDIVLQALASNLHESSQFEAIRILDRLRVYSKDLGATGK